MTKDLSLTNSPEELQKIFAKEQKETDVFRQKKTFKMLHDPFYHFMKEMKPKVQQIAPDLKYLEVIAFIQEQWTKIDSH